MECTRAPVVVFLGTFSSNMSPKLTFNHFKVGFQSLWRRDFCNRWTDNRKKVDATTPRTTTPEIRALVTGFIGWELAGEAGKWRFEN